jgi:predicted ArsR family transcriptional regulator
LLVEHAATTQELAERLKTPISTVAHHLQVLTDAGLIRVVRTRQVKALTQRYFGCTARSYVSISSAENSAQSAIIEILTQSVKDIAAQPDNHRFLNVNLGYARIPRAQAEAFAERLHQLVEDFEHLSTPGEDTYGFFGAIYQK